MTMEHETGGKQKMDIHFVHAPVPCSVEENFEGFIQDHDDLTLAQLLQDQETVYQSLQRNAQIDTARSSNTTTRRDFNDRQQIHGNFSPNANAESQLAMDEAFARELQELENQVSLTSLSGISGAGTRAQFLNDVARAESYGSSSRGNSTHNTAVQIAIEDDVNPDNMTYEELQSLGEAMGTKSRGLPTELISYLPRSTYKIGLFQRRENHEECVICCMTYKNRDKLITLPCQHQYHEGCVTKWLKISKTCPVCNNEVFGS